MAAKIQRNSLRAEQRPGLPTHTGEHVAGSDAGAVWARPAHGEGRVEEFESADREVEARHDACLPGDEVRRGVLARAGDRRRRHIAGSAEILLEGGTHEIIREHPRETGGHRISNMRSTAVRARRATAGSICTSWRRFSSAARMLPRLLRFMCGHRLHGRTISTSGSSAAMLSLIEHSVMRATRAGCSRATWATICAVEPEMSLAATTSGGHSGWAMTSTSS